MNELLDIEIILNRKKYSKVYNIGIIILCIIGMFVILTSIYDYRTYLVVPAQVKNGELQLLMKSDDVRYLIDNDYLVIDEKKYQYVVKRISDEIFQREDGNIYQYIYIDVNNFKKVNNYIYQIRVLKEEKKLIEYLKEYL